MSIGSHQPIYATNTQYKIWHNQRNTQNLHQYFTIVKPQFHLHRITSQFLFIFRKPLYLQRALKLVFWFLLFWICKAFPWSRKRCVEIRLDFCFFLNWLASQAFPLDGYSQIPLGSMAVLVLTFVSWIVVRLFSSGGSP